MTDDLTQAKSDLAFLVGQAISATLDPEQPITTTYQRVKDYLDQTDAKLRAAETEMVAQHEDWRLERWVTEQACKILSQGGTFSTMLITQRPPWWSLHPENVYADLMQKARDEHGLPTDEQDDGWTDGNHVGSRKIGDEKRVLK